jgi:hypothetical protein
MSHSQTVSTWVLRISSRAACIVTSSFFTLTVGYLNYSEVPRHRNFVLKIVKDRHRQVCLGSLYSELCQCGFDRLLPVLSHECARALPFPEPSLVERVLVLGSSSVAFIAVTGVITRGFGSSVRAKRELRTCTESKYSAVIEKNTCVDADDCVSGTITSVTYKLFRSGGLHSRAANKKRSISLRGRPETTLEPRWSACISNEPTRVVALEEETERRPQLRLQEDNDVRKEDRTARFLSKSQC